MVGLSANGALNRAKAGQNFVQILTHYYKNIGLDPRY
jgi:peptidoglycan hydrolase-like amidase